MDKEKNIVTICYTPSSKLYCIELKGIPLDAMRKLQLYKKKKKNGNHINDKYTQ
jgi:hypothetical protein